MEITAGTIVFSKAGRDNQNIFLTLKVEDGFAYIADGKTRKVEKPKKKKLKHLQRTNKVVEIDENSIENYQVRKILADYRPILEN